LWKTIREVAGTVEPGKNALLGIHAANLEQLQGLLEAAVEERAPVVVCLDQAEALYAGPRAFLAMARELAAEVPVPVAVLLDHVKGADFIGEALSAGYTGFTADMRDKSASETRLELDALASEAKSAGAFMEVSMSWQELTSSEEVGEKLSVIMENRPDSLCISLGEDGKDGPPDGFFDMIEKTHDSISTAISVAGAGDWKDDDLKRLCSSGPWLLSVGTRTNRAFTEGLKKHLSDSPGRVSPIYYFGGARDGFRFSCRELIILSGSSGLA